MVKQINVYFDEEEYKELIKKKENLSWHDFILKLTKIKNNKNETTINQKR